MGQGKEKVMGDGTRKRKNKRNGTRIRKG